ncbi:BppU family phage baseplate upper protein [Clostridium perfringens]|uniref:BppU family phage baseplate upper protein n=1 Tax=Clostridium perfringens TaxID=1502 RepID=UPI003219D267
MKNIEIYNTLNIDKDSSSIVATFTQEDDAVMEFKLFKDGQEIVLKDQTISLGAERKDGAVIEQEDGFLIKEDNILNITLKKNIISVVGVVKIQLYLKDTSGEMASNTFNIRVNKKLLGAENIEATNDIKTLNTLVLELKNNTNKLIDDTKAKADKLLNGLQETGDNLSSTVKAKTDKLIEDTKKDYDSLKKTIIDENISIKLQEDIKTLQNGLKTNQNLSYEGSSINAENTLEGRTEGMRIKGRTLQNLFTTSANNLRLSDVSLEDNIFVAKPVNGRYPSFYDLNGLYKENTSYTVVLDILENTLQSDSSNMNLYFGNAPTESVLGQTLYKFDVSKGNKGRFIQNVKTIPSFSVLTQNLGFKMYMNNNYTGGKLKFNIMVIETSMLGDNQIPDFFKGIKSFGEVEQEGDKYKISILSTGKNLFDINKVKLVLFNSNGYIATENYNNTPSINLDPNTNYAIKFPEDAPDNKGFLFDRNGFKTREISQNTSQGYIFTTTNDEVGFSFYRGGGQITFKPSDINNYKIMLIEGTKTIDYEPYQFDKKDILIKEPLRENDVLYEDNGQVKVYRDAREYTFTGDEDGRKEKTLSKITRFYIDTPCKNIINTRNIICNNFNSSGTWWDRDEIGMYWDTSIQGRLWFHIKNGEFNDFEALKNFLKANKTTIVYQLDKPVIEVIENCVDIDLDTYQDKTYFNILNALPGALDFKIPSNLASIVQSHTKDIKILYDLIDRLLIPNLIENKSDLALLSLK